MDTKINYYEVLGIPEDADQEQIRKAYKKLAIKWHPDKHTDDKEKAQEKFKEISAAYAILGDEKKRKEWDAYRKGGFQGGFDFGDFDEFDIFKDFFRKMNMGFGEGLFNDDNDDFFNFDHNLNHFGNFESSSSFSTGGMGGTSKSVKKSTTIKDGRRFTRTETTIIENGKKRVEVTEGFEGEKPKMISGTVDNNKESDGAKKYKSSKAIQKREKGGFGGFGDDDFFKDDFMDFGEMGFGHHGFGGFGRDPFGMDGFGFGPSFGGQKKRKGDEFSSGLEDVKLKKKGSRKKK